MENLDNIKTEDAELHHDEDEMFLKHVIQDDHDLYYMDVRLNEMFRQTQQEGA